MSSRALRKLHGEKDEFPHNLEDGDTEEEVIPRPVNNKKKKKGMKVPLNPFDMVRQYRLQCTFLIFVHYM